MRSARFAPIFTPTLVRAWLLALVLVASQAAGLAHRIVHGAGTLGSPVVVAAVADLGAADGFWSASHQKGSADCRLIDQLAHADVLCAAPVLPVAQLPAGDTAVAAPATPLLATPAAAYFARGPPPLHQA